MWIKLHRLIALLRQRQIDLRDVTVFVDYHVINPRFRHRLPEDSTFGEDEDTSEDEPDEY